MRLWHKMLDLFSRKPQGIEEPRGRLVSTSRGGLNMPKKQPCPMGHGWKKRDSKTMGGAHCWCNTCQHHFFVKAG